MKVTGYCHVSVSADSYEEALQKANKEVEETDFGQLEDINWDVNDVN